ncbi:MAG: hypothetical protein PHO41_11920 [Eubacteriales bacterium]|nr:hypothetical protein [Eubacteriales bacterium]
MQDEIWAVRNPLKEVPANNTPPNLRAFGIEPHFYDRQKDLAPMFPRMKVTGFLNARKETRAQRFWRVAEPWLWSLLLTGLTVAAIWAAK